MIDDFNLMNIDLNVEENNNNNANNAEHSQNKIFLSVIIFISLIIVGFNFYQVFYIIRLIKRAYIMLPKNVFEECYLYNGLSDLLLEFYSFFLGIDLIYLCSLPFINFDIGKLEFIFPYLNYLVFGPFTIGIIITILSHANKLMFICVRYKPENKIFNFKLVMFLFFASLISFLCTFFGILFFVDSYFDNSINYKPSGSYILGYIFWKYGFTHSRRFRQRNNDNNNNDFNLILNNDGILPDQENDLNI